MTIHNDEMDAKYSIRRKVGNGRRTLQVREYRNADGSILPVLTFPALEETGIVQHLFTTRLGGVSEGPYSSLNLSFTRGDREENIRENYRRVAAALGTDVDHMVLTNQKHGINVRRVSAADAGKGTTRPRDWEDLDGLVTNEPGLALGIFSADCVPILFVDPVHKAIGACHSGWRGTVRRMGAVTLQQMTDSFGTSPKDAICAIGPSICQDCYEISDDVAEHFIEAFPEHKSEILLDKHNGHQMLNLWAACRLTLLEAGVPAQQIHTTDICTCENPDFLFSHRAVKAGPHGNMGAFILLK